MYAVVNMFNILLIEYRDRVGRQGALQRLDSADRGSESPRPAADLFTTKSQQQQPAGTAFLLQRCSGRKEVHILPFPQKHKGSLLSVFVLKIHGRNHRCWFPNFYLTLLCLRRSSCHFGNSIAFFFFFLASVLRLDKPHPRFTD